MGRSRVVGRRWKSGYGAPVAVRLNRPAIAMPDPGRVRSPLGAAIIEFHFTWTNLALVADANDVAAAALVAIPGLDGGMICEILANDVLGVLRDNRVYEYLTLVEAVARAAGSVIARSPVSAKLRGCANRRAGTDHRRPAGPRRQRRCGALQ